MKQEELLEELFCIKFENKALADIFFRNEAERWVYSYMYDITEQEHLVRYKYVKDFAQGKKVLDIACGSGFGSYLIATEGKAKKVVAVDLDSDSIRYANHRFPNPAIERQVGDAQEYEMESEYDIIVSFETIEHLPKYEQFLKNMSASLKNDGLFYVSTPIVNKTRTECKNPYHVIEWSFNDFQNLISQNFNIEEVYLQNVVFKHKKTFFGKYFNPEKKQKPIIFEKYSKDINFENVKEGYQLLICSKKI